MHLLKEKLQQIHSEFLDCLCLVRKKETKLFLSFPVLRAAQLSDLMGVLHKN